MSVSHRVLMGWIVGLSLASSAAEPEETLRLQRFEAYPESVQSRLDLRDRHLMKSTARAMSAGQPLGYVIQRTRTWLPGQTVKVAFSGGDAALRRDIMAVAQEWTKHGRLVLDFGVGESGNTFREWSPSDQEIQADLRISFDETGYWSLVGTDSINLALTKPGEPSMSLAAFTVDRPRDWRAVVLHEFGHALGFQHEHQSPKSGCEDEFRWEDDAGYAPTQHPETSEFIRDANQRRPGIYTVLGGPPNNWPRPKVDHNLRRLPASRAYRIGAFDRRSIMKYRFPAWMFVRGMQSTCYGDENLELSENDKLAMSLIYPAEEEEVRSLLEQREAVLEKAAGLKGVTSAVRANYEKLLGDVREAQQELGPQ